MFFIFSTGEESKEFKKILKKILKKKKLKKILKKKKLKKDLGKEKIEKDLEKENIEKDLEKRIDNNKKDHSKLNERL